MFNCTYFDVVVTVLPLTLFLTSCHESRLPKRNANSLLTGNSTVMIIVAPLFFETSVFAGLPTSGPPSVRLIGRIKIGFALYLCPFLDWLLFLYQSPLLLYRG